MKNGFNVLFVLTILISFTLVSACSTQSLYETGQGHQKNECMKEAQTPEQHNQCLTENLKTYKEYEKERQAIIKQK